jgi:hypothetical protein
MFHRGHIVSSLDLKYLYITFLLSHTVNRINLKTGAFEIIAGKFNEKGCQTNLKATGIPCLNCPQGLIMDQQNNLLVCDSNNHRIVKINTSTGNFKDTI